MAQFDVYRVRGNVLVVDCQADLLSDLPTRLVAPLRRPEGKSPDRLIPVFEVDGHVFAMMTPLLRSIATRDIEATIANLTAHEFAIKAALDMLISGFERPYAAVPPTVSPSTSSVGCPTPAGTL